MYFLLRKTGMSFFKKDPGIVFVCFGVSFGNLELWFEDAKEKKL